VLLDVVGEVLVVEEVDFGYLRYRGGGGRGGSPPASLPSGSAPLVPPRPPPRPLPIAAAAAAATPAAAARGKGPPTI
jgi:hypothetical protein